MLSEMFYKLWNNGLIQLGVWETIYMTLISSAIAYVIGLPLGVILSVTDANGIRPTPWVNRILGFVVNFFRSIPFIILMVAMLPVAKFIIGTSLGQRRCHRDARHRRRPLCGAHGRKLRQGSRLRRH